MQSSTMVALRTMVMVTCLVAVPLAAVVGTALPKVLKSALHGETASFASRADSPGVVIEDEPQSPAVRAPLLAGEVAEASSEAAPGDEPPADDPVPVARITGVRPAAARPVATITDVRPTTTTGLAQTAPLWSAPPRTARPSAGGQATVQSRAPRPLLKTDYTPPPIQSTAIRVDDGPEAPLASLERPAGPNDSFARSERRLRELGATHYRLETWGARGEFYRCTCNIPVRPRSPAARHFESIEPAPSEAIEAVIRQVEHWRTERRR
ncbi:MAG TPA: hypothetical protein VJ783_12590 [Pirellulales bacterium]|nr:hypothetical protein [Pirellulales bacterium]